jgi:hypothetical protein
MKKFLIILLNALPIIVMIGIIPLVPDDYILTVIYVAIIAVSLLIKKTKHDISLFVIGFVAMFGVEYFFVSTGVETFHRKSLLGLMPLWLPFLWGYSFIAIKRLIKSMNH